MTALARVRGVALKPVRIDAVVARHYGALLALLCLAASIVYVLTAQNAIANWGFPDPDDQMRLQQVRDLLAGQSWFDVTQYRMNPPFGAPMHWSRLIDVPIAGTILLLRPLLGPVHAEVAAVILVPLMTLAAGMAASASLARRLLSPQAGLVAAALVPLTTSALQQMRPLRIDHHGWQVVICILIARALLMRDARRSGAIAGALAATWLTISLEGLPFAAAAGALVALRWLLEPEAERPRFEAFAAALGIAAVALFTGTRSGAAWGVPACDAVSPVHLGVLAFAALGTPLATRFGARTLPHRLAALALVGAGCGAAFAIAGPDCLSGAFSALDPLVARYWYDNVLEGLPLWKQSFEVAGMAAGFPLVGLCGACLQVVRLRGETRQDWAIYALLLAAAVTATIFVQRSGAMANMLALPGGIVLMTAAFARAQRLRLTLPRVLASVGVLIALLPTTPGLLASTIGPRAPAADAVAHPAVPVRECTTTANFATAGALSTGILFTNIDIGPGILFTTRHTVIASGHHRNRDGIHDVLSAFLGTDAAAHAIIRRRHVAYVVVCSNTTEMGIYRRAAPRGLWSRLATGHPPAWLTPAPIPGSQLSVWKVIG